MLVEKIRTPLPIGEMLLHGADAYKENFKRTVETNVLAMAGSQWTTECGIKEGTSIYLNGNKVIWNIWNNNWGNITCKKDDPHDKHALTTKERVDKAKDVWRTMTLYYKAYHTPGEGAADYWLKMKRTFPKSLASFATGNTKLVAETLSNEGYYTDYVEKYKANLDYFFPRYVRLLTTGSEK